MFWVDQKIEEIKERFQKEISEGQTLVIRDEKTASGKVHVGSMMGVAVHGIMSEALTAAGVTNKYYYEINNTDPMDGLPKYLDEAIYLPYMGKQLKDVPAPDNSNQSYADFYGNEFKQVIRDTGYTPEFYNTSELYETGKMNDYITQALNSADKIRSIYWDVSKSKKDEDWLPLNVVCESCGKISTTKVVSFDGENVAYVCKKDAVEWAEGCEHEGTTSPYDGNATLPWKVEWAAKFAAMNVKIEAAGKDHCTKGGARDAANKIAKDVFEYAPPYGFSYEFFLVGGKKMSSSKGNAANAKNVAELLPPHIFRLALTRNVKRQVNFDPEGDTIPRLFDLYDDLSEKKGNDVHDDTTRVFDFVHPPEEKFQSRYLPRFSTVSFLVQMSHLDLEQEVEKLKGDRLTEADKKELLERAHYAKKWITEYAPEDFVYALQETIQEGLDFSDQQKEALKKILEYVESHNPLDAQELHTSLHDIRSNLNIEPKEFFQAIYKSFLGKDSGPKAGWFFGVMDRDFLITRLKEASS